MDDISTPNLVRDSFAGDLVTWFHLNCSSKAIHHSGLLWQVVLPLACWNIWLNRNKIVFKHGSTENFLVHNWIKIGKAQEWEFVHNMNTNSKQKTTDGRLVPSTGGPWAWLSSMSMESEMLKRTELSCKSC